MRTASDAGNVEEDIWKIKKKCVSSKFEVLSLNFELRHFELRTIIFLLLASCLFLLFASCAKTTTSTGRYKHISPKKPAAQKIEHERAPETGAKKEIIRAEQKPVAMSTTPKGRASQKLLEDGRRQLANGENSAAVRTFQEAINIDPSNGIAYYYLAKAKFELGEFEQASGVLDKAEELLGGSNEWLEAIAALREMIKEKFQ